MDNYKVTTPCVGVCSTGIGDSVCRGCKRFAHEIIAWNGYSDDEKSAIVSRLSALLAQVVQERISVVDSFALRARLEAHGVRCSDDQNDYCLAFEAIRRFGSQLPDLTVIGCSAKPRWQALSVVELKKSIDDSFYQLSCAHFERYFPGHL